MTARIIQFPGVVGGTARTNTDIHELEAAPFTSVCPKCKDVRFQRGYTPRSLFRLLGGNHPIEAYCVVCDRFWPVSAQERYAIARRLASSGE